MSTRIKSLLEANIGGGMTNQLIQSGNIYGEFSNFK
jgi:hypothetical protein